MSKSVSMQLNDLLWCQCDISLCMYGVILQLYCFVGNPRVQTNAGESGGAVECQCLVDAYFLQNKRN